MRFRYFFLLLLYPYMKGNCPSVLQTDLDVSSNKMLFFSRGTQDDTSVVHIKVVGGLESFYLNVMHFIAAKRANLTNLRLIPFRSSSSEVSPNRISLGSLGILVPTTVPVISKTPSQYTSRSGQDHNMCKSVPLCTLHLGHNSEQVLLKVCSLTVV